MSSPKSVFLWCIYDTIHYSRCMTKFYIVNANTSVCHDNVTLTMELNTLFRVSQCYPYKKANQRHVAMDTYYICINISRIIAVLCDCHIQ